MSKLPRPVWLLGWVSLATDAATEAIYPLLPFFLTRVLRTGAVSLGIIEGAAEAVNSLLKILGRPCRGSVADQAAAGAAWLQHFILRAAVHRRHDHVDAGVRRARARPGGKGHPGRAARRHAGRLDHAGDAWKGVRLSSRDGSRRRDRRARARVVVPVLLSRSIPPAVRADDHSGRHCGGADFPRPGARFRGPSP